MDTLREYLKIKKMSSNQEIGEYVGESLDTSSFKGFLTDLIKYLAILRTIEKEEDQHLWADYERKKAKYRMQLADEKAISATQIPPCTENLKGNVSKEARVIPLFRDGGRLSG
jgi:hypothetical protein